MFLGKMGENSRPNFASHTDIVVRPLKEKDVPQIVPLLAKNYETQDFRIEFFKHIMRQPAPMLALLLFGCISFFVWKNAWLAIISPVILYIYLAALYHFQVHSVLKNVPDLKDIMQYYIRKSGNHFWVAVCGDEVAGSVGIRTISEGCVEIKRMQVSSKYRQRGIASRLMDVVMKYAKNDLSSKKIVLSTTAIQVPAQGMYLKYGFQYSHTEKRYVGPLKIATMDLLHFSKDI